jgi:hypothetical protein
MPTAVSRSHPQRLKPALKTSLLWQRFGEPLRHPKARTETSFSAIFFSDL